MNDFDSMNMGPKKNKGGDVFGSLPKTSMMMDSNLGSSNTYINALSTGGTKKRDR